MYFQMYQDARYEWRWRLNAGNHETIAVSSEGYTTKTSCERSIALVKQSYNAPVYQQ